MHNSQSAIKLNFKCESIAGELLRDCKVSLIDYLSLEMFIRAYSFKYYISNIYCCYDNFYI